MAGMTHAKLVEGAARWLRGRCPVVITEMAVGIEQADAIGFKGPWSTLVECKASRSDFLADRKKCVRGVDHLGMGLHRYYCAPKGLIAGDELPNGWGLLEAYESGRVVCAVKSAEFPDRASNREVAVLVSALRRIGGALPDGAGVSVKYYTYTTGNTATLGVEPATLFDDPADSGAIAPWEPDDVTVYRA